MSKIKLFISYSGKNDNFAGELKRCFEKCVGFQTFLAHDDLNPSDDFILEIMRTLENSDFFIPLISKDFLLSSFANQELGMALGKDKKIIPISIDGTNPQGLIGKFHAHKCKSLSEEDSVKDEVLRAVTQTFFLPIQHPNYGYYKNNALDSLIYALSKSDHFRTTSIILRIMIETNKVTKFNKQQLANIVKAAKENPEVYRATFLFPKLVKFLQDNYKIVIDI